MPDNDGQPLFLSELMLAELDALYPERAAARRGELAVQHLARATAQTPLSEAQEHERRHRIYRWMGDLGPAALCLSGGGIRSASFALGLLQALARHGLLLRFQYLSTVSGGGYIGAWLTAWRFRAKDDTAVVQSLIAAHQPPEIAGLRADSNYLTPKIGVMSADTWAAVAMVVRNLVLNWTVFLPLFLAAVLVPILCADFIGWVAVWPLGWIRPGLLLLGSAIFLVFGLSQTLGSRIGVDAGYHGISQKEFLGRVLLPTYIGAVLLVAVAPHPLVIGLEIAGRRGAGLGCGVLAGIAVYIAAWGVGQLWWRSAFRQHRQPALQRFLCWTASGAAVGAIVALGYRGFVAGAATDFNGMAHDLSNNAKNLLVVAGVGLVVFALEIGETLYVGLASTMPNGDAEREWRGRSSGWLVAVTLGWLIFSAIVLFGPQALKIGWNAAYAAAGATVTGLVSVLLGSSARSAATAARQTAGKLPVDTTISIATLIFLPLLAILLAGAARLGLDAIEHTPSPDRRFLITLFAVVVCLIVTFGAAFFVNVNRFSMHAIYRNRLVRAFLGSARTGRRNPDRFTGFDPDDNLRVSALWPPAGNETKRCLFPVLNMALNVVATKKLAWQERKAEPFVVTPLACGSPWVDYRETEHYGGRGGGITLGTAMAISGAAASPNEGYYSSPLVGLLMMLANVRLGWWLGNPRYPKEARRDGPRFGFGQMLKEMFGLTTDSGGYVYLSDGGHFENLGLYEMVRRRCRYIVVSDAGCDPDCQLDDLGNAVRKIRIDLGIDIRFRAIDVTPRKDPAVGGVYCAVADIDYPERPGQPGKLLYVKPGYHGTEPADIRAYAAMHPSFPHEDTVDQWFTESQMESYRALGNYIFDLICRGDPAAPRGAGMPDLPELFDRAEAYLKARMPARPEATAAGGTAPAPPR